VVQVFSTKEIKNEEDGSLYTQFHHPYSKEATTKKETRKQESSQEPCFRFDLAWAWTFWKAQGQTFRNKIIMEKENGLTYTGFSRATKLSNIGIIGGLSLGRFTEKIRNHKKMKPRREEERRQISLSEQTVDEIVRLREEGIINVRYTEYN
jgi:ATP-dependent exoDNAse (exonuclease V) alpha subunit